MLSYTDITKYFGSNLFDKDFQSFLTQAFCDLTGYDILESDYIISKENGIELGFTNTNAFYDDDDKTVFGNGTPIFSHFIIYPKSSKLIDKLPFDISFSDNRIDIATKAGTPTKTNEGYADFLNSNFLVDNYKINDIVVTFDYNTTDQTINFIQVRDNNLV
jgi:hypothetical protein